MSTRSGIYDAVVTKLTATSSAINYVTRKREEWWNWPTSNFPGVCVIDTDESKRRLAFVDAVNPDMYSEFNLLVIGYERDITNELDTKRANLIAAVESSLAGSTGVNDLTLDIIPVSVKTDDGMIENFCITEQTFRIKYAYNHGTP